MNMRIATRVALMIAALPALAWAADAKPEFDQCWKATFTEQLSGPVHEKKIGPARGEYLYSHDGYFQWSGKPVAKPVASQYVVCLRERMDDGGVLITNDKRMELARVGSLKLPEAVHNNASFSYTSGRDSEDFPSLYGIFKTPGKPDTSLEIQVERLRGFAVVVVSSPTPETRKNAERTVTYMKGDAVRVQR